MSDQIVAVLTASASGVVTPGPDRNDDTPKSDNSSTDNKEN